jgi:hypothetical protein
VIDNNSIMTMVTQRAFMIELVAWELENICPCPLEPNTGLEVDSYSINTHWINLARP